MKIDLRAFTDEHDVRPYCRVPLRLSNGYPAATDGCSIMVLDQDDFTTDGMMAAPDNIEAVIKKHVAMIDQPQDWKPISGISIPSAEKCDTCKGTGRVIEVECYDCDGEGEFMHGRHWYECNECEGSGYSESPTPADKLDPDSVSCSSCRGTGRSKKSSFVSIDGMPRGYGADQRLLSRYPADGEYALSSLAGSDVPKIILRGNGWRGCVMPMRE